MWSIGPFHIKFFGIAVATGILVALSWWLRTAERHGINRDTIYDLALWTALGGMIGARVVHVALEWSTYAPDPFSILYIQRGGLSWHGGLLGGGIAAWVYLKRKGLPFLSTADTLIAAIPLGQAIGRVGCDIFGTPTNVPWAVTVAGQRVHPQQVYELLWDWGLFLILAHLETITRKHGSTPARPPGSLVLLYAFLYSVGRFGVEYFRPSRMLGPFSDGQWASLAISFTAVALFIRAQTGSSNPRPSPTKSRKSVSPQFAKQDASRFSGAAVWIARVGTPILLIVIYYWRVRSGIV